MTPAYSGFSEFRQLIKTIDRPTALLVTGATVIAASVLLFFGVGLPAAASDVFSSASYFDGLGFNLVWEATSQPGPVVSWLFSRFPTPGGQPVSIEGFVFGILLSLVQIILAFQVAYAGDWYDGEEIGLLTLISRSIGDLRRDVPLVSADKVNWQKVTGFSALMFMVFADTYTDIVFRGPATRGGWFSTTLISTLYYNLGSEFALITAPRTLIYGGVIFFGTLWELISGKKKPPRSGNQQQSNRGQRRSNQQRQNNQQQRGGNQAAVRRDLDNLIRQGEREL